MPWKRFGDIVNGTYAQVTTTKGEVFDVFATCEMYALVYIRFGRNLTAAKSAIERMLQTNDIPPHAIAELVAAGLAMIENRSELVDKANRTETDTESFNRNTRMYTRYETILQDVVMAAKNEDFSE